MKLSKIGSISVYLQKHVQDSVIHCRGPSSSSGRTHCSSAFHHHPGQLREEVPLLPLETSELHIASQPGRVSMNLNVSLTSHIGAIYQGLGKK